MNYRLIWLGATVRSGQLRITKIKKKEEKKSLRLRVFKVLTKGVLRGGLDGKEKSLKDQIVLCFSCCCCCCCFYCCCFPLVPPCLCSLFCFFLLFTVVDGSKEDSNDNESKRPFWFLLIRCLPTYFDSETGEWSKKDPVHPYPSIFYPYHDQNRK